ncbi:MAG: hypothetical protein AAB914_03240 [Patescibacteria group bacterium]
MYKMLLIIHIASGLLSFVLVPFYLYFVKDGSNKFANVSKYLKFSFASTVILGFSVLLIGGPITRSCITLGVYSVMMLVVINYGDKAKIKEKLTN